MTLTTSELQKIIDKQANDLNNLQILYTGGPSTVVLLSDGRSLPSFQKAINDHVQTQQQSLALQNAISVQIANINDYFDLLINNGVVYQSKIMQIDDKSRLSISAAALMATIAINNGKGQPGNYRWVDPDSDFGWIAEDNTILKMDAPSCVVFGLTVAQYYTKLVFNARILKDSVSALTDLSNIQNFDIENGWPSNDVSD